MFWYTNLKAQSKKRNSHFLTFSSSSILPVFILAEDKSVLFLCIQKEMMVKDYVQDSGYKIFHA